MPPFGVLLSLGVLGPLSRLVQAHLLALYLTRVAGDEARLAQRTAQGLIVVDERPGDGVSDGTGLAAAATAGYHDLYVEPVGGLCGLKWLAHDHPCRLPAKVLVQGAAVDDDVALAGLEVDACR